MGQGMVEQVLSLRPEDRRALIEEAADVRLYRQKLEDAQKKLKETRENVDRVRMLVREIEPRINQLERQAGRAVKYRELAQELAASLHVFYSHQWQDVNDLLLAAITTQDQRAGEFEEVRATVRALEDGLVQLRTAIDERKAEIARREQELRGIEDYARDLERRVALDEERERMLMSREQELTTEIEALRVDLAAQESAGQIADTSELESRLSAAREELSAERVRLDQVDKVIAELHRTVATHEHESARALAAADELARRIAAAADAIAEMHRERDTTIEERRKLLNEREALATELSAAERLAESASADAHRALEERERESRTIALYREQRIAAEEELRALRVQMEKAAIRLEVMEELEIEPQPPDAGVRAILEAAGQLQRELTTPDIELRGVVGLLGQLVRVPHGLEDAVQAAMAENLHAVVFEKETDLRAAVKMLVENDFGRATMYALDAFNEGRPIHIIKERGVVGVASGLVRCDSKHRRLVDTLLGRTVVVENLDFARRYVRRGLASAVATSDGILLRPIGSVQAGAPSTIRTAFVRQRDVGDLPEELAKLRPRVEERETSLHQATVAEAESQSRLDSLAVRVEELRAAKGQHEAALANARVRLATLDAQIAALDSRLVGHDQEIARLTTQREADDAEEAQQQELAGDAASRLEEARTRLAGLEQERAPLLAQVAEMAAQVAHLDGELRTERSTTQGERMARERLAKLIAGKEAQQLALAEDIRGVVGRLNASRRELGERNDAIATLRSDLEPAREELTQLESRERSMTAQLAESNERLRSTERSMVDAESEVRIRREELDTLRATLEAEGFVATADGEVERLPEPEPVDDRDDDDRTEDYASATGEPPSWMRSDDELPPMRGGANVDVTELRDRIADLRAQIRSLGPINVEAADEYGESRERFDYLTAQLTDLSAAEDELLTAVSQLDREIRDKFRETFKLVNAEFERYFSAFFRGGTARLELGETDEEGLPGIEIYAQPPGKKLGSLNLLSGGERSLTAVALLFALLQANPSPICVLDEVDAALDEANVGRFVEELRALAERTQFIIITHNRRTIENADTIYGVSMGADSVSRVLSLRLDEVKVAAD
jgi:chromosome segregation protein